MTSSLTRHAVALALVLAACGGGAAITDSDADEPATEDAVTTTSTTTSPATSGTSLDLPEGELPEGPSALSDMYAAEFPEPLVDPAQIRSGGPPPDGIPPIDDPVFTSIEDAAEWLSTEEAVVVVEIDGDARAYPVQVLIWHEIVNDTVGDVPVSVTYCPLCNSAIAYDRRINGVETTFGTSGRLFSSALVMYDRATETLWTHFDGRAVVGVLAGLDLDPIPAPLLSFGDFVEAHPDGVVLDRDETGHSRDYGRNPYVGYDDPDAEPFLFRGSIDDRASAMQRVAGVTIGDESVAFSLDVLASGEASVTEATVGGTDIMILWKAGQSSGLEQGGISDGRDVGSVGVFLRTLSDGTEVSLTVDGTEFVDDTGSRWNVSGQAVSGPREGEQLERVPHLDTFWFAWSTYRPGTTLVGE